MKKINFNKRRMWLRPVVLPFVFGILLVAHLAFVFKRTWHFLLYGGEWINHEQNEATTMDAIYQELKLQNKLRQQQIKLWDAE